MKFGDNERAAFKKDLQQAIATLEKKYGVKVGMLKRESDPNYIGLSIKEIVETKPVQKPEAKPAQKPAQKMEPKKSSSLDDIDLENLNLDDLDFSDLGQDSKKASKPEAKPAQKPAPAKSNESTKPVMKDELDDLENLDIDSLDFSDLGADDEDVMPKKSFESKPKKSSRDDDDRYSQELEKYLGKSYTDSSMYGEPDNIFDELKRESSNDDLDDISEEELDAYLASSGVYSFSFQAKLIQGTVIQDYYTDVKNLLLSYNGVKSKVSWDYDSFLYKDKTVARVEVDGDTLYLYLKLDFFDYEDSHISNIAKDKKFKDTPLKVTINSMADVDTAYELIEDLTTEQHIYPGEDRYDDYHFSYETNDELIARGLIKKN